MQIYGLFFGLLLFSASYGLILYYQMQMLGLHDTCIMLVLLFDMRGEYKKNMLIDGAEGAEARVCF